uniref:mitogen-activated protein kinase kinase n=1 Tax=Syphacia muris TaxID=451379 RepID=A0A0N5B0P0_9BILA
MKRRMYPAVPPIPDEPVKADEVKNAQIVPDANGEMTDMKYIRCVLAGKLSFPDEKKEYFFEYRDLEDLGPIGEGSYGRVNKVRHIDSGKLMAVKKLRIVSNTDDRESMQSMNRLKREVEAIRKASQCPEIVRFYGLTVYEGDCIVCMELMDISLRKLYETVHQVMKESFDERILGHTAVSVLKALSHLKHQIKIIHRDVKPSNILLARNGMIKLCDFGISGYLINSVAFTRDAGCRPYMAPERLLPSASYDVRSDVWSLGITLKEVADGKFPYPYFNENELFFQLHQVVHGDAPVMEASDKFSSRTAQFINSCLTKELATRPNFDELMETEFFKYYNNLPHTAVYVANYVERVLKYASSD